MSELTHALTVLQPWAGLIAGVKTVEFRPRPCPGMVGKRIAIRSGKGDAESASHTSREHNINLVPVALRTYGSILAVATIAECRKVRRTDSDQLGFERHMVARGYAWVLSDVQALARPLKWGKPYAQVWAKLPPEVAAEIERGVTP